MASDREPFEDEVAMCRAGAMNNAEAFASLFEPDPFLAVSLDAREVDFGGVLAESRGGDQDGDGDEQQPGEDDGILGRTGSIASRG